MEIIAFIVVDSSTRLDVNLLKRLSLLAHPLHLIVICQHGLRRRYEDILSAIDADLVEVSKPIKNGTDIQAALTAQQLLLDRALADATWMIVSDRSGSGMISELVHQFGGSNTYRIPKLCDAVFEEFLLSCGLTQNINKVALGLAGKLSEVLNGKPVPCESWSNQLLAAFPFLNDRKARHAHLGLTKMVDYAKKLGILVDKGQMIDIPSAKLFVRPTPRQLNQVYYTLRQHQAAIPIMTWTHACIRQYPILAQAAVRYELFSSRRFRDIAVAVGLNPKKQLLFGDSHV